ncbi:hypothetical protein GCM10010433_50370 [Streptomyces pulveraceus]
MVKDQVGFHDVGDAVRAAAKLPKETPALEGGHGLLTDAADLGVGGVVAALPSLGTTASERNPNKPVSALTRLVVPAFESRVGEGFDDPVPPGCGEVAGRAGQYGRGPQQTRGQQRQLGNGSVSEIAGRKEQPHVKCTVVPTIR